LSKSSILVAYEVVAPEAARGCTSYKLDKQQVIKSVKKHLDNVYKTQTAKKDKANKKKKVEKAKKRKARLRRREDGRGAPTGPTGLTHHK
jgi:hypothetical protein